MALSSNSLHLIATLEQLPLLDGRYEQISCVNADSATGETRGVFSLVFRAFDSLDQRWVALKFFDIAPQKLFDQYRVEAFRREHSILQSLFGARRCLQVVSALSTFNLQIPQPSGASLVLPCIYFAVEWIDEEVDEFFENQHEYEAISKLQLFNEIVLSVEALHSRDVHHRDLKKDNLRDRGNGSGTVVAIDLGAAARLDSPPLRAEYDNGQVGAPAYAGPEAICGLAGLRKLGRFTDIYALGCMLFELFNRDLFFRELLTKNPHYISVLTVMGLAVKGGNSQTEKLSRWHDVLLMHGKGVTPVSILTADHTVPAAVAPLLDDLVKSMTHTDYQLRPKSLEFVRRRIRSAITCLNNAQASRRKADANRARRTQRIACIKEREERLAAAMARGVLNAK